jgi:hypothetical protein
VFHCAAYPVATVTVGARMASVLGGRAYPLLNGGRQIVHRAFGITPYTLESQLRLKGRRQRIYLALRDRLWQTGLGQPLTDVETAVTAYEGAVRVLVAHENLIVLVRGPLWNEQHTAAPKGQYAAALRRVGRLDDALAATCARLRIAYDRVQGTDAETVTAEGQAGEAEREFELIRPLLPHDGLGAHPE